MLIRGRKKVGTFKSLFSVENFFLTLHRFRGNELKISKTRGRTILIKEENSTLCEVDFAVFIRLVPCCLQSAGNGRRQFGSAKYDGLVESKKKKSTFSSTPSSSLYCCAHFLKDWERVSLYREAL